MITLKAYYKGVTYPTERFMFYTMRESMQRYRLKHNLKSKHIEWAHCV